MEINKLFGLPAHPLLVHIPVVLVPLAALGALLLVVRPQLMPRLGVAVAVMAGLGLVGVQLAMGSGEQLEEASRNEQEISNHAHLADQTRPVVFLFALAVIALVVLRLRKPKPAALSAGAAAAPRRKVPTWLAPALSVVVALTAVGSIAMIARTGHTGAKAVWHDKTEQPAGGEGAGSGQEDGD